jgi:peptidoglycan/LPS O-acetylase OafA/YrhL
VLENRPSGGGDEERRVAVAGVADPGKAWRRARGIPIVPAFDGYRAIGIFGVALFHVLTVSGTFGRLGGSFLPVLVRGALPSSVVILFVVSGFVVYLPTVARGGEFGAVGAYAIRRGARILPAYWLALGVALILLASVSASPGLPGAGPIVTHLFVLQAPALLVAQNFPLGLGVIAPVWTLSLEIGFYIVLPFIAAWYFRRPFVGFLAGAAIVVAWHVAAVHADGLASLFGIDLSAAAKTRISLNYESQLPSYAIAFAAGMTGAWLYVHLRDRWSAEVLAPHAVRAAAVAGLVLILFVYLAGRGYLHSPLTLHRSLAVELGLPLALATALVAIALGPGWLQRPFGNRGIRWVADISYGVFLIHFAVIFFVLHEFSLPSDGSAWAAIAWSLIVFPVSIFYAYLSARLLEQPIRRWAHRFGRRVQAEPEPSPAASA